MLPRSAWHTMRHSQNKNTLEACPAATSSNLANLLCHPSAEIVLLARKTSPSLDGTLYQHQSHQRETKSVETYGTTRDLPKQQGRRLPVLDACRSRPRNLDDRARNNRLPPKRAA